MPQMVRQLDLSISQRIGIVAEAIELNLRRILAWNWNDGSG